MEKVLCLLTFAASILTVQSQGCDRPCNGVVRTCTYTLVVDYFYTMAPDCRGCTTGTESDCYANLCVPGDGRPRLVKGVNGTLPGPAIVCCVGDKLVINVVNLLAPETTTIHWHGMHQVNTQSMDGVPMVTQYPIQPEETYTYRFTASERGTHFWHSHSGSQRADGVFGPLIVRNNLNDNIPVTYDYDMHVISMLDWFGMTSVEVAYRYLRTKDFYDTLPKSLLINGHGHDTVNRLVPPRRFAVDAGRSYRIRIIHAGNIVCPVEISIDNHQMQLFNMDGNDIVPRTVDAITLSNGERADVVLRANQPVSQYTIRFTGTLICNVTGFAKLHYNGATQRSIVYTSNRVLNSRVNCVRPDQAGCISYTQLQSYNTVNPALTKPGSFFYFFSFDQYLYAKERFRGVRSEELFNPFINEIAFVPPQDTFLCNYTQPTCEYDARFGGQLRECTHVVTIPSNTVVELILTDMGKPLELQHPMHLHGHSFAVVGYRKYGESVDSSVIADDYRFGRLYSNSSRPIIKDTVGVPDGGVTIIRFITDNPGFWLFHCHVDFHTEEGMQLVLSTSVRAPTPDFCRCKRTPF